MALTKSERAYFEELAESYAKGECDGGTCIEIELRAKRYLDKHYLVGLWGDFFGLCPYHIWFNYCPVEDRRQARIMMFAMFIECNGEVP